MWVFSFFLPELFPKWMNWQQNRNKWRSERTKKVLQPLQKLYRVVSVNSAVQDKEKNMKD